MMLARFRAYLLPYYRTTVLPYYRTTVLPYYRTTVLPYYRTTVLPNDPASQQTTGHQQGSRTQRQQRGTARGGKRATRSSRCGATAAAAARRSGAAAAAATGRSGATAATGRSRSDHGRRRSRSVIDVDVPTGSDALEARAHLVLADAQILRDTGEILLVVAVVLSGGSGLDLVAVHVLDAATHGVGAACGHAG